MGIRAALYLLPMAILTACVSAPREAAVKLADSGIAATNSFSGETRKLATDINAVAGLNAFNRTWDNCQNPNPNLCIITLQSPETRAEREQLVNIIQQRSIALDALGQAYAALKAEGEYDAKGHMMLAMNEAFKAVNIYADMLAAAGVPGAGKLSSPLTASISYAAGLSAEQKQRNRIIAASASIRVATQRFRDCLEQELYLYDSFSGYVSDTRFETRKILLRSGVVSHSEVLAPIADNVGMKLLPTSETTITKSPALRTAIEATLAETSYNEHQKTRLRYLAGVDALDAVINGHRDLEADRQVSLDDVYRFISELNLALKDQT